MKGGGGNPPPIYLMVNYEFVFLKQNLQLWNDLLNSRIYKLTNTTLIMIRKFVDHEI